MKTRSVRSESSDRAIPFSPFPYPGSSLLGKDEAREQPLLELGKNEGE